MSVDKSAGIGYVDYKGYQGNPLLKRPGIKIEWTETMVEEYIKCSKDPVYFIENHMKIINVDDGLVPFILRPYQKEIIKSIHDNRYTIICTARQAGKSVTMTGYILWYMLFNENIVVALLANKGDTAREILGKVQTAYYHLPAWMQSGVLEWNKGSISLENGSRAIAGSTSTDAIRGYTINLLVLDEAAHIEGWEEFSTSVLPTISSGKTTKVVQISTPFGLNHFHKTWQLALERKNEYFPILVPWTMVPGRDEKWRLTALQELNFDTDKFNQEYACEFQGSSGTLIAGWKLKELHAQIPMMSQEGLYQYEEPEIGHLYVILCDVSEGKGFDFSAMQVIDITIMPYRQAAVYYSNLTPPDEFAQIVRNTAVTYNNAAILVEFENLGPQVAEAIYSNLDYDNLLMTESAGTVGKRITTKSGKGVDKGVKMTATVKKTGCSILKLLVEQNQLIINDHSTISELSTFSKKNTTFTAEPGCHDDLVMCLVIFAWLSDQAFFRELTDISTISRLRERSEQQINEQMLPFGFHDDGRDTILNLQDRQTSWIWAEPDEQPKNF
jgi:hypothetical protein